MSRVAFVVLILAVAGAQAALFSECSMKLAPSAKEIFNYDVAQIKCYYVKIGNQAAATIVSGLSSGFFEDAPTGFKDTTILETLKDPSQFAENMNIIADASALRQCVADKLGLVKTTLFIFKSFDDATFQAQILAKVQDTDLLPNVKAGIKGCGKVKDYNIVEYMDCIVAYCETGSAPN